MTTATCSDRAALGRREAEAWRVLGGVMDPEVPVISVVDLGIVREVRLVPSCPPSPLGSAAAPFSPPSPLGSAAAPFSLPSPLRGEGPGERGAVAAAAALSPTPLPQGARGSSLATLEVVLTPTYSGCPATELIESMVREALVAADLGPVRLVQQRAPAWTTDWISETGRRQLREYGIAPPARCASAAADGGAEGAADASVAVIRFLPRRAAADTPPPSCPRCDSADTERLSAFGSTACKALYRCRACREPFELFKPI